MTLRIDARIVAAAIAALGIAAAAPDWAAAQASGCNLWSRLEAAVKAVDVKAALAAERDIYDEPDCSKKAVEAKQAVLDVYRAQDERLEKAKAAPRERLAQLVAALKFANRWNAWDIHAKIADLQRKVPGAQDHAKISMGYDRALVAVEEAPESKRPGADVVARLARLAYQFEALSDTPIKRDGAYTRSARQVNVGYVPAPLQFEYKKADLTLKGQAQAQILLAHLKAKKMPELLLIGHTDPVGSFEYNDELSLRRAEAIKQFLVKHGYPPNRISIKGRGKRDVDALKIEDREAFTEQQIHQMLRRVELKFKD